MKPSGNSLREKSDELERKESPRVSGVDLFCGVGGLTHGLVNGGIEITAGVDLDENCRFPYEANNKSVFVKGDLSTLTAADIEDYFVPGTYRLLAGCAPCQPFSTYSQKGRADRKDDKWNLLSDFGRIAQELQPELITMENVPQLTSHSVFKSFLDHLAGYHVWFDVVDCTDYGIPQTRKRLVLLASKLGAIELILPTQTPDSPITVKEAIKGLPRIRAGQTHPKDPLHSSCSLSETNLKRIQASKPGGTWRDWPKELRAKCHKKKTGTTYPSVYGRMDWTKPAPTITTQCFGFGNGRFGHPEQDRAISLREAAILQTFPHDYKFLSKKDHVKFNILGRLIGNAVPVRLGEVVAESILFHLKKIGKNR